MVHARLGFASPLPRLQRSKRLGLGVRTEFRHWLRSADVWAGFSPCVMLHRALLSVPSALRSCHLSMAILATTASADFCPVLTAQISLSKTLNFPLMPSGSTRVAAMLLDFTFTRTLVLHSWPLCQFVFLRPTVCLRLLSASTSRSPPCRSATVAFIGSDRLLSFDSFSFMSGTRVRP